MNLRNVSRMSPRSRFNKMRNKNTPQEPLVLSEEEALKLLSWVGVCRRDVKHLEIKPGKVCALTETHSYDFDLNDTWDPYMEYDFPWKLERISLVCNI